jgi:hypothetical protein
MSVFLADDFVFTKNGVSPSEPWTIMRLQDMLTLYFANREQGKVLVLRRKDLPNTTQESPSNVGSAIPGRLAFARPAK